MEKMQKPFTEWEKISANYIFVMGLVMTIQKNVLQLNKNTNNLKLGKRCEQTFFQR